MQSDIRIAQDATIKPISQVAARVGLLEEELIYYGGYKAKVADAAFERLKDKPDGNLVLVTAISPTPAGEGKTTTTVGLGQALCRMGESAVIALREPSLGPVFGVKGGAAGGGYSQVLPMEDINLHFTGDLHAVTSANNLLCAMIDNHIHQGNALGIDPRRIVFKRVMDINDRALRSIVAGLGGPANGLPREDGFQITVASEIMAILCLAEDIDDLKERLGNILVAWRHDLTPVFARDLKAAGAMAALLRDAIKPNLVQTLEGTPCLMHGGPFANIAHGCNSVRATRLSLKLGDYCITEAGFGSDLGAEKFFDIKCRKTGLKPDAVVLVATVRALKYNGGVKKDALGEENLSALEAGCANLRAHIGILHGFGLPVVVSVNVFDTDTPAELALLQKCCADEGVRCALSEVFAKGGEGGLALARLVREAANEKSDFTLLYPDELSLEDKISAVATRVYGAAGVSFDPKALSSLRRIEELGFGRLPVCMAKTQYSLSDDASLLGRPEGFTVKVREVRLSAGAGFVVAITGDIMTMPGLPKTPAAERVDIDGSGVISGLF